MEFRHTPFWQIPLLVLLANFCLLVYAEFKICTDGASHVLHVTNASCPFGLLFFLPQVADCLVSTTDAEMEMVGNNLCGNSMILPSPKLFQFLEAIDTEEISADRAVTQCPNWNTMCKHLPIKRMTIESVIPRPSTTFADFLFEDDNNSTNKDTVKRQTMRLFQYMIKLSKANIDESLRIVDLLKKSFEIFKKFTSLPTYFPEEITRGDSPHYYIRPKFLDDVERAFLFMLNEADSTWIQDVSMEEYQIILEHLNSCELQKNPFTWEGEKCATYSVIQRVQKSGRMFIKFDESNIDAFSKFDIAVEATWGTIDFVHGLCYGTFRNHINSHHLYQRAMERLFTNEILFRWQNRFVFQGQQEIWSNFFSQNVKNALINMDICIQASYMSTPFHHRLERPIDGKARRRRKRWVEVHTVKRFDHIEGYCFQNREEKTAAFTNKDVFCD